jgi:hypothetical protein
MKQKVLSLFRSRRFYSALAGIFLVLGREVIGLDDQQAQVMAGLIAAWIVGDSLKKTE